VSNSTAPVLLPSGNCFCEGASASIAGKRQKQSPRCEDTASPVGSERLFLRSFHREAIPGSVAQSTSPAKEPNAWEMNNLKLSELLSEAHLILSQFGDSK